VTVDEPACDRDQLEEGGTFFDDVNPGAAHGSLNEESTAVVLTDRDIDLGIAQVATSQSIRDHRCDLVGSSTDHRKGAQELHRDVPLLIDTVVPREFRGVFNLDLDDVTRRQTVITIARRNNLG
jgi:hypothetical protein